MRMFIKPMSRAGSEMSSEAGHGVTALILGLGLGIVAESLYPQLSRKYQEYREEEYPEQVRGEKGYFPASQDEPLRRGSYEGVTEQSSWIEGVSGERRRVSGRGAPGTFTAEGSIAINRPPVYVYRFWKDLENLPRIFDHLDSVNIIGRWRPHERVARFTSGPLMWDVEITNDIPNELITWTSVEGAQVKTQGEVYLEPRRYWNDTIVTVSVVYGPPLGTRGAGFAGKFGENPSEEINRALRKMKSILEYGEA